MIVCDIHSPLLSALNNGSNDAWNCKAHDLTMRSHALNQITVWKSGLPDKSLCALVMLSAATPLTAP